MVDVVGAKLKGYTSQLAKGTLGSKATGKRKYPVVMDGAVVAVQVKRKWLFHAQGSGHPCGVTPAPVEAPATPAAAADTGAPDTATKEDKNAAYVHLECPSDNDEIASDPSSIIPPQGGEV